MHPRWIASAYFDLGLIIGPPVAAVLLVLALPALRAEETPVWGWVLFVVCIDVTHVYASLYRTYFQPDEFARRRLFYMATPLACFLGGVALYSLGHQVFWRVLAYIAVFHFVRQQYGLMMVYRHRAGEHSPREALLDKCAIYAAMVYPLALWHRDPSTRNFQWFIEGDFVQLPEWVATGAVVFYTTSVLLFAARQVQVYTLTGIVNWGKIGIVGSTAAVWYVGIAFLNSDFAFTATNVVAHGVPYMALVWLYGHRRWAGDSSWRGTFHRPAGVGLFVGLLIALAYSEEALWELFVWQEHAEVFLGMVLNFEVPSAALTILVPLLTVPQATHYILDAKIWKFDGSNPNLRYYLFLEGEVPRTDSEFRVESG